MSNQYHGPLARDYSSAKRFEHPIGRMNYEEWLREVGDVNAVPVLDLACGSGYSSRLLAGCGALVTGVDEEPDMIARAKAEEERLPQGIKYVIGDAATFDLGQTFELVTPTYLLHYAETVDELSAFCEGIAKHLVPGGRMVALHAAADPIVPHMRNGQHSTEWIGRPYEEGSRLRLHLYDLRGNEVCNPIIFRYWSVKTYRKCLEGAGMVDARWVKIQMSDEAKRTIPNWKQLDQYNTSCVLTAHKA